MVSSPRKVMRKSDNMAHECSAYETSHYQASLGQMVVSSKAEKESLLNSRSLVPLCMSPKYVKG